MAKKSAGAVPISKAARALRAAIAAAQKERGLNNSEAAELAGVARPNYVGYVYGDTGVSLEKLADVAKAFGIDVSVVIR
jgi:transcriptional regulator with XRE-family HTH domain